MKSLFYPEYGRLSITDTPTPTPESDCVIVKVAACGICGSEIETFMNRNPRRKPPLVMGHEFCGTVTTTGKEARKFKVGDHVIANSIVHCGSCAMCAEGWTHLCEKRQVFGMHRPGAFAELVNVPERVLVAWPAGLPAEQAVLAEPMANGIHVANLLGHIPGKTALVIGAGPIGLMCQVALTALRGATVYVTDLNTDRLKIAQELGAVIPSSTEPEQLRTWLKSTAGRGFDVIVDAVGSSGTKRDSLALLRPGGACVWIGLHENPLTFNSYEVTLPEKQILGTYAATVKELAAATELVASGRFKLGRLISSYSLDEGISAFEDACAAKTIKSVVIP